MTVKLSFINISIAPSNFKLDTKVISRNACIQNILRLYGKVQEIKSEEFYSGSES
jgi:hypothetical protein